MFANVGISVSKLGAAFASLPLGGYLTFLSNSPVIVAPVEETFLTLPSRTWLRNSGLYGIRTDSSLPGREQRDARVVEDQQHEHDHPEARAHPALGRLAGILLRSARERRAAPPLWRLVCHEGILAGSHHADRSLTAARPHRPRGRSLRRGPAALPRAVRARGRLAARRRPDAVDDALGRRLPRVRRRGLRRPHRRRRRARVRRPVPGRHRRDARPRPGAGRGGGPRAGGARDHDDAADRGRDLGRRGAVAPLRAAALAVHADRHRRQPHRAARRPPAHRPPLRPGVLLLLPRLRRRGVRDRRRRRRDPRPRGQRRPAGGPGADHAGDRVQRPRGARARRSPTGWWPACWPSRP